jgi:hypothetical protein
MKKLIPVIIAGMLCGGFVGILSSRAIADGTPPDVTNPSEFCRTTCAGLTGSAQQACWNGCDRDSAQCGNRTCTSCCEGGTIVGTVPNPAAMCYISANPTPQNQADYAACVQGCKEGCKHPVPPPGT